MKVTNEILDNLTSQAKANSRLRQVFDLRTSPEDNSQRILNALEPGTILPIHRHRNSTETMIMVRGSLIERFYNDDGTLAEEFDMRSMGDCSMIQIEAGQWHSLEVLESGTVIFEAKDGKYKPLSEGDLLKV